MRPIPKPAIFVFFGLIASGKSTLGQAFAKKNDLNHYNSDVVRKNLAGQVSKNGHNEDFDQGIYSKDFTHKTYSALLDYAESDLAANYSVVLDASYQDPHERGRVRTLAETYNVPLYFILCLCPEEVMKQRMETRALDPNAVSDGRWEIYLKQKERFKLPDELPDGSLITIQTADSVENLLTTLETVLTK